MADNIFTSEAFHNSCWKNYNSDFKEQENLSHIHIALEWIRSLKPKIVLDLGCGPAYLAQLIKKDLPKTEVDGVDISLVALEYAKEHLNRYWQLDIDKANIPITNETYDAIVCLKFIEHIYDVHHALSEIKRLLKKSGRALISIPNLAYWRYRLQLLIGQLSHPEIDDEKHIRVFNFLTLKHRLYRAGLKVERYWGYGRRFPILACNYPKLFSSTIFVETSHNNT